MIIDAMQTPIRPDANENWNILRDYQQHSVTAIRVAYSQKKRCVLFFMATGGGKCLAHGTPVVMFDGTIKPVEDVQIGDLLMGPDSKQRVVTSLARGREAMYRIAPVKGDPYTVNESHILSLKITGISNDRCKSVIGGDGQRYQAGDIANITVRDYLKSSATFRHVAKGWRPDGIDFAPAPASNDNLPVPPYILGVWLAEGSNQRSVAAITNPDKEVCDAWLSWGDALGCSVRTAAQQHTSVLTYFLNGSGAYRNPAVSALKAAGQIGCERNIPNQYLTASRKQRLELLAGIVDGDGYLHHNHFEIVTKYEKLRDGILFLARSVGLAAYSRTTEKTCTNTGSIGVYHVITISGDVDRVPCRVPRKIATQRQQKKSVHVTGIKAVEPLGEGDYYGFSLDGPDRLFLLGDFTVTHNTLTSSYIVDQAQLKGKRVLILVHRTKLMKQFSEALTKYGVRHGLIAPGAPFDVTKNVQVAKVGTMVRRMHKLPWRPDFIIVDEAHHCVVGTQFGQIIERYAHAPSLLLSATPWRLNGDGLGKGHGGYADAMVLGPDAAFLIERENLSPYKIYGTSEPVDMSGAKTRGGDWATSEMEARIDKPMIIGNAVSHYTKLAKGKRAIVFTPSIRLAEKFAADFCAAGYKFRAVHGEMKEEEQDAIVDMLDRHEIDGIVTVDLVSEGFDLPAIECAIFLRPTASLSLWLQMVGRVLRPSPGKDYAIVLDHVGNSSRHGLPDDPREWTLEGRPKKQGKPKEKPEDPVKQCDRCGAVHRPASKCPECGYVYAVQSRTVEEVDGELKEIEAAKVRQERRMLIGQCRTYEDFVQVGQQLGYKPGWALVQFDIRQQREQERRQAALQNRLKYCRTFEHFERLAQDFGLAPEWAQYQFDQCRKIAAQEPHQVQSVQ